MDNKPAPEVVEVTSPDAFESACTKRQVSAGWDGNGMPLLSSRLDRHAFVSLAVFLVSSFTPGATVMSVHVCAFTPCLIVVVPHSFPPSCLSSTSVFSLLALRFSSLMSVPSLFIPCLGSFSTLPNLLIPLSRGVDLLCDVCTRHS